MLRKIKNFFSKEKEIKEIEILRKDLTTVLEQKYKLEIIIGNIGYDLSKLSIFLENRNQDELEQDIKNIEIISVHLRDLFHLIKYRNDFDIKISKAEIIEKSLYHILRNYSDKNKELIDFTIKTKI